MKQTDDAFTFHMYSRIDLKLYHKWSNFSVSLVLTRNTFCPCIGFISGKYRVSQKIAKNGEHCNVDFQFKLC